jgi:membrane protein DedA with SNARE-associated domain
MVIAGSFIDTVLGRFGYGAVFSFVAIESLGIPFPGETMLVAAALYAGATGKLSIAVIIAVAAAGAIIGDNIGYGIGHWGGTRLLQRHGHRVRLTEGRVKLVRYLFARHGGKVVFLGRFVSVLRTYAALLAGTARMSWPRFLVFNAAGGVVWASAYGLGAYAAGTTINRLSGPVDAALAVIAAVVIVVLVVVVRRKEDDLVARAEAVFPGPLDTP